MTKHRGIVKTLRQVIDQLTETVRLLNQENSAQRMRIQQLENRVGQLETETARLVMLEGLDRLTGLYNRNGLRHWWDAVDQNLAEALAMPSDTPEKKEARERAIAAYTVVGVGMIDVDHFKEINDTYGHDIGDVTLRKVAEHIRRSGVIGARYGGDEFIFLLTADTIGNNTIEQVCENLRSAVSEPTTTNGHTITTTISVGISPVGQHDTIELSEHVTRADAAMYRSKQHRNTVTISK